MKSLAALQGYKSFIVNTLTAIFNILVLFNFEISPENQAALISALVTLQGVIAHVMRLVTKTPPGKDIEEVRESVVVADKTKADDILGEPNAM